MFKIDFMSSLRENKINGFDLAIMEQIEHNPIYELTKK